MKRLLAFSLLGLAFAGPVAATNGLIPIEALFRQTDISAFKISPDGQHLAALAEHKGVKNIAILDVNNLANPQLLTGEALDVTNFVWLNDNRIAYRVGGSGTTTLENQRRQGGLYAVDIDGKNFDVLTYPYMAGAAAPSNATVGGDILSSEYDADPDNIVIQLATDRKEHPDVYLLNINNGRRKLLLKNPADFSGFVADTDGVPRVAYESRPDGTQIVFSRQKDDSWKQIAKYQDHFHSPTPIHLKAGSDTMWVSVQTEQGTTALTKMDLNTGELAGEPVVSDPVYDVDGAAVIDPVTEELVGIRYEADKPKVVYLDPGYQKLQQIINNALPNTINDIYDVDNGGTRVVIEAISDTHFPIYYLLDLDKPSLQVLADTAPWLSKYKIPEQQPVSYKARDGRTIHGYLTLPTDYKEGDKVPLIVHPHGGPWARDTWGLTWYYEAEPKFMASRGFAVLQVNFRGSTGYGIPHLEASMHNVDDMMTDLIDGIDYLVEQGIVDNSNVGIWGASWGGYSTMYCLTKFPDRFTFGVNMMGVVDVPRQIYQYRENARRSNVSGWEGAYNQWAKYIGNPDVKEDRARLEEWSPVNFLGAIDDPVFIYHGLKDMNVDIEQARILIDKMAGLKKPFTRVIRTKELHSANDEAERIDLYQQIEKFIKPFMPERYAKGEVDQTL